MTRILCSAAAIWLTVSLEATGAMITFDGTIAEQKGTGFGNVLNVLSVQQRDSEYGSILLDALGQDVRGGDACPNSTTQLAAALQAVGIDGTRMGIVLNIAQTGHDSPIYLSSFMFRFYTDPSDTSAFFDAAFTPGPPNASTKSLLPIAGKGTGTAGYLFRVHLDEAEAAAFFGDDSNRVGAYILSDDPILGGDDGMESFYLTNVNEVQAIPEPATLLLLATGALAVSARARRRRR